MSRPAFTREQFVTAFWQKVNKAGPMIEGRPELGPCWLWTRSTRNGYGQVRMDGRTEYTHRVSWWITTGDWPPDGTVLDHFICHDSTCVNPAHLRAVTNQKNSENWKGPRKGNRSGVRGVTWHEVSGKWMVRVQGRYGGLFSDLEDAKAEALAMRLRMMTHSDGR